jgi:hypothetical protein
MGTAPTIAPATTYTMLDGRALDLSGLTEEERAYLARCYAAYRAGMAWEQFGYLAVGPEHPLLRETGGVVTPGVWAHPLYQAVRDLEDRLGIQQGELDPDPGSDVAREPLNGDDSSDGVVPTM